MEHHEDEFERYLRQFRPRAPSRLPGRSVPLLWRARIALAAAVVVIGLFVGWFAMEKHHHFRTSPVNQTILPSRQATLSAGPPEVSLASLNAIARRSPSALDAALMDISPHLLPNVQNPHGSLYVLAGE